MKLQLNDPFTIEIEELNLKITGFSKKLTKKQESDIKKKFKKEYDLTDEMIELYKKLNRLQIENKINGEDDNAQLLAISDRVDEINNILEDSGAKDKIAKYRFIETVESDQMEELIKLADDFGYPMVMGTIAQAVKEGKSDG